MFDENLIKLINDLDENVVEVCKKYTQDILSLFFVKIIFPIIIYNIILTILIIYLYV